MRDFNRFYELRADTIAYEDAAETVAIRFDAIQNPARALATIQALPPNRHGLRILVSHANALHQLERYQEVIELLASRNIMDGPLHGDPGTRNNHFQLALHYVVSLKQLGRDQEARALAQRMLDYIQRAVDNGQPPNYYDKLAIIQLVMDEQDAAVASLRTALQNYDLDWALMEGPWFSELRDRPDFREIHSAVMSHTNSERARLGWAPVAVAEL
jgi:tetratricopeptide (TPR) repeat protein